jgi:hypothetical protein
VKCFNASAQATLPIVLQPIHRTHKTSRKQPHGIRLLIKSARSAATAIATAGGIFAFDPGLNDVGGAPHTRLNVKGLRGTVARAGAAFHASIPVANHHPASIHFKYAMGTHQGACPAAVASGGIKGQGADTWQIEHIAHGVIRLLIYPVQMAFSQPSVPISMAMA